MNIPSNQSEEGKKRIEELGLYDKSVLILASFSLM